MIVKYLDMEEDFPEALGQELLNGGFDILDEDEITKEEEEFESPHTVVLVMGLDESGKTSLLSSMIYGEIINTMPTELKESQRYTHNNVQFVMREIGGRYRFRDDWEKCYNGAQAIIWVIDSIDRGRIIECREEFDKVLQNEKLRHLPVIVALNKQDSRYKMADEDIFEKMKFDQMLKMRIVKTSKKASYELIEAMDWLVEILGLK